MEWLERMQKSLNYLEEHLESKFDINEVARVACSSPFHFQRMFYILTGVTVAEYIRRRRLTLAAQELASTHVKVIDLAFKYGYDTPESFSKAFRKVHGLTPTVARGPGVKLKAFPRLSFQISLKGDKAMDYRIFDKEAFRVIGKCLKVSTRDGENLRRIPSFWDECCHDGSYQKLASIQGDMAVLGICRDFDPDMEELVYMVAVEKPVQPLTDDYQGFEEYTVPASTWAVFESVGSMPDAIQKVWQRVFSEWFPATGYEHAGTAELESYPPGNMGSDEYYSEVWIPVKSRE